jgi:hypothetical protein
VTVEQEVQVQTGELTGRQRKIRDEFVPRRGFWSDGWQRVLELAPDIMAAYTDLSAHSWEHGSLDPKTCEFMYIATTASATHIHPIVSSPASPES